MMPTNPVPSFQELSDADKMLVISLALNDMSTKVGKHHTLLVEGNGEKPLPERVRNLEKFMNNFDYWAKFLGGALILNFVGFATGIILALVKFLPLLEKLAK